MDFAAASEVENSVVLEGEHSVGLEAGDLADLEAEDSAVGEDSVTVTE